MPIHAATRSIFVFLVGTSFVTLAAPLQLSVYCTAGDIQRHMGSPEERQQVLSVLQPLHVSHLFLEGRRGDEYVSATQLRELRDFFVAHQICCSGGIATVPGAHFGQHQNGELGWLNWESRKTQSDVASFFAEDAPVFNELIVDDFFCTGDVSPQSEQAKGSRSWGQYRRDLMVSLINPLMVRPTKAADPHTRLILKFPQWYDRFQLFGYDPPRMATQFDQVWVGTEVRDPETRRMGFVQPTEGYMNFRWLASQAPEKVRGAWFDHIECSAQNFLDQAYQSVLAGASELTLFHLGDLMDGHPGDALLAAKWPDLCRLAASLKEKPRRGIAYYKPAGSDGDENLYLADYLGMIGLPVLPVAQYPKDAAVAFLPVQAAADPALLKKIWRHLQRGATLVVTPALVRSLGSEAAELAGVDLGPVSLRASAVAVRLQTVSVDLERPLEVDAAVKAKNCRVEVSATVAAEQIPFLTSKAIGRGQVLVLNVRTFNEQDFGKNGEWLLAPALLGLPKIPPALADKIRDDLLAPLGFKLEAPAGVQLVLCGTGWCIYSFLSVPVGVKCQREAIELSPHQCMWTR